MGKAVVWASELAEELRDLGLNNSKYLLSACCSEHLTNSFNPYHTPVRIGVVIILVL